jgi:hypothetical protein
LDPDEQRYAIVVPVLKLRGSIFGPGTRNVASS